jgi:peptidoglycan hydrolase-like protein with peptidoglycan-binding domain
MSVNRLAWVGVAVVVLVVGALVVRTLRQDTATRTAKEPRLATTPSAAPAPRTEASPTGETPKPRVTEPDKRAEGSIYRAKAVLKSKGYYGGPLDNNFDRTVEDAIKKFQQDAGMTPNGRLDQKTYAALGIEVRGKRP